MGLRKDSIFSRYFFPVGFTACGVLMPICSNYISRRPVYAGIQRHIALGITGFIFGLMCEKYLNKKWEHRDAVIKHYIELHPEDFQDNKRKYGEIFEEWYPVR